MERRAYLVTHHGLTLLRALPKITMVSPRVTSHIPPLPADPYCFLLLENLTKLQPATS